jgi:hypothetical protein
MPSPAADVVADFARVAGELRVTWYLFGAQAAILRGVVRLTADVDVTVMLGAVSRRELVDALDTAGFQLRVPDDDAFVAETQVFPFVHVRTGLPVDVVLGGPGLEEDFAAHAELVRLGSIEVPVATATDLVIMKLIAARAKDLSDAAILLAIVPPIVDVGTVRATLAFVEQALGEDCRLVATLDRLLAR